MSTRFIVAAVVGVVVGVVSENPQAGFQAFSLVPSLGGTLDPKHQFAGERKKHRRNRSKSK